MPSEKKKTPKADSEQPKVIEVRRRQSCIYVLKCPTSGEVRYVGKTRNAHCRRWQHQSASNNLSNRRIHVWVRSLLASQTKPEFVVIEETDELDAREQHWVAHYLAMGVNLLNMNEGGTSIEHMHAARRSPRRIGQTRLHKLKKNLARETHFLRRYGKHETADICVEALRRLDAMTSRIARRLGSRGAANEYLNEVYLNKLREKGLTV